MEELIVLGTGNAAVTKCFNTCFAIKNDLGCVLVDTGGGNGILTALEKSRIPLAHIHHIFITHEHTDHMLGIIWLIRMIGAGMNRNTYDGELHIYCHEELVHAIRTIVPLTVQKKFYQYFDERILFHPVNDKDRLKVQAYTFTFFDIGSTKAKQFGFTARLLNGRTLTCLGDEPYKESSRPYLETADWLLLEAFCLYEERDLFKPYEKHHSTVKEACQLAQSFQVPNLVLWHTEDTHLAVRRELYTREGCNYYYGHLHVPDDLDRIVL